MYKNNLICYQKRTSVDDESGICPIQMTYDKAVVLLSTRRKEWFGSVFD